MNGSSVRSVSTRGVSGSQACTWYRSTESSPSRRSEASSARVRWRAESPAPFGESSWPRAKRPLVASTTSSVTSAGRLANQRPMISSDRPSPYTSAVSTRLPPASMKRSSCWCAPCSSVSTPNVIVPRHRLDTAQPLRPRVRYSIPPGYRRASEQNVKLADSLVDLPGPGPAAGEYGRVARPDLGRLAVVRGDRHAAGQDVHELVVRQAPPGRPGRALPDPGLLSAFAGPQSGAGGVHRLAGGLLQRPPVLELGVGRGGQERGDGDHDEVILSGKGRAMGSVARRLWPASSKRSRPSGDTSSTSEEPVSATSAAARATPGPHIIPAPPAQATVTPASPGAGPMMGR